MRPRPRLLALLAPALALAAACSDEAARAAPHPERARPTSGASPGASSGAGEAAGPRPAPRAAPRVEDPRLPALRAALDQGRLAEARVLLAETGDVAGVEGLLLRARARCLEGLHVDAGRLIEQARERAPSDARVYATAAELHAAAGRFETAWAEVRRGEQACGAAPELVRARGVLWISREGGAEQGVELLEQALAADPDLPFTGRALGQGRLLLAKRALAAGDLARALDEARRSLASDPHDVDARRFEADALAAGADFEGAILRLEALLAEGVPVGSELALMHKRAGMKHLIEQDRAAALESFRRARAAGLTDEELGTGAHLLEGEAARALERGVLAFEAGDDQAAAESFRAALLFAPGRIEAHNHLGVALYRLGQRAGAIEHWRRVVDAAAAEDLELPEPVHLHLAQALVETGDAPGARAALAAYLARRPDGDYAERTRARLAELGAEPPQAGGGDGAR